MSVAESREETTFSRLEDEIEASGEVMVRTTSGDEFELHKHNVEFESEPYIRVEADEGVHWIDATAIERYWIHEAF